MDKLGIYYSGQKIDDFNRKYGPSAAYIGLQKVINLTDKTTKTCQNNHEMDKGVDYYSKLVSDCVIEYLKSLKWIYSWNDVS